MSKNNIKLLQENLLKVINAINYHNNEIWFRIYPPSSLDESWRKKVSPNLISQVDKTEEFVLYIHIPFCNNKCDYCGLRGTCDINKIGSKNYVDCLKTELENILKINKKRKILALLIGGGTPSMLAHGDLKDLMDYLQKNFILPKNVQFCMEAAPSDINEEMAEAIVKSKINRICLGVQTFNEKKLRLCNRSFQKNIDVYNAVKNLRKAGLKNISFDLIYGLKENESADDFLNDNLEHILELQPENIDIFALQNYRKFPKTIYDFPSDNLKIINQTIKFELSKIKNHYINKSFKKIGIRKYNVDNLPIDDSSYFFLRRCLLKDVLAIGLGAKGDYWRNGKYIEKFNANNKNFKNYQKDIKNNNFKYNYYGLTKEESLRKHIVHSLNRYGIYESVIKQKFPKSLNLFYKTIDSIKDVLNFSNGIYFLKQDYERILPFKTKNKHINYFIFSFCYLYSKKDQEILLKKLNLL